MARTIGLHRIVLVFALFLTNFSAYSEVARSSLSFDPCVRDLQTPGAPDLYTLLDLAKHDYEKELQRTPEPDFLYLAEDAQRAVNRRGIPIPAGFRQFLPDYLSLVAAPTSISEDPSVVKLVNPGKSVVFKYDEHWRQRAMSTYVYASLPKPLRPLNLDYQVNANRSPEKIEPYLVGPEYDVAIIHYHGVGTPMSSGVNAMSIGQALAPFGVAVVGIDMPGHGRSTHPIFKSFREMREWFVHVAYKLVHPGVKRLIFSGHSGGGVITLAMSRESDDTLYHRVDQFIPISPAADLAPGGSAREKIARMAGFDHIFETLRHEMAATDLNFLRNVVLNGKRNIVSDPFIFQMMAEYDLPRISMDRHRQLKPTTVIWSKNDGLTSVGRIPQIEQSLADLIEAERLVWLQPGNNFRSPKERVLTGHDVWGRYIDGTEIPETYARMALLALTPERISPVTQEHLKTTYLNLVDANHAKVQAEGESTPTPESALDSMIRPISYSFLARKFFDLDVQYERMPTEFLKFLTDRKKALESFLASRAKARLQALDELKRRENAAQVSLRSRLHLDDNIVPLWARIELLIVDDQDKSETIAGLSLPMANEDFEALQAYDREIVQFEETEKAKAEQSFSLVRQAYYNSDTYSQMFRELNITPESYEPLSEQWNKSRAKDPLKTKWQTLLNTFHQEFQQARAQAYTELTRSLDEKKETIQYPAFMANLLTLMASRGLEVRKTALARRLIDLQNTIYASMTPEQRLARVQNLRTFITDSEQISRVYNLERVRNSAIEAFYRARNLTSVAPTDHEALRSYRDPVEELQVVTDIIERRFAPPGNSELASLVSDMAQIEVEKKPYNEGENSLRKLEDRLHLLKRDREAILKSSAALWNTLIESKDPSLMDLEAIENSAASLYKQADQILHEHLRAFDLELYESGRFDEENLYHRSPAVVREALENFISARAKFLKAKEDLVWARIRSVVNGSITSQPQIVSQIYEAYLKLYGSNEALLNRKPDVGSLEHQIATLEDEVQLAEMTLNNLNRRAEFANYQYLLKLKQSGFPTPYHVRMVRIGDLIHDPDLLDYIRGTKTPPGSELTGPEATGQTQSWVRTAFRKSYANLLKHLAKVKANNNHVEE